MNITETILTTVLITLILPVVFSLFWFFKLRSEKDISSDEVIRTRPPKMLSGFFLGFGLIVLLGGIGMIVYSCITDSENTTFGTVVMMSVFVALFSAIGFFAYAYYRFNYVVADTNGILVYRLSAKRDIILTVKSAVFRIRLISVCWAVLKVTIKTILKFSQ